MSGEVHQCDTSVTAPLCRIVQKCDLIPLRRDARKTDPARGLVQNFADRILEPVTPTHIAHDCQILSIWRPVRLLNVFNTFSGSATNERYAGQSSSADQLTEVMTVKQDGHFSGRGDGQDIG